MSPRLQGHRDVCTQGQMVGEEGIGYSFQALSGHGDYSVATRGYYQGYTEPCEFELLVPGARVLQTQGGDLALFPPEREEFRCEWGGLGRDRGLFASEALLFGLIRVID